MRKSSLQQLRFSCKNMFGKHGLKHHGFIIGILKTRYTEENLSGCQNHLCHCRYILCHMVHAVTVHEGSTFLLAQTHRHHLAHTALHRSAEGIMGLNTAGHNNTVCFICIPVHVYSFAAGRITEQHRIHG